MVARVTSHDLSPIYRDLYNKVAALPAFEALKERAHKDVREAKVLGYSYKKTEYGNDVTCAARVQVGCITQEISFRVEGDTDRIYFSLETDHLISEDEVDDIYFENVGRYGKPIRPHGLVKEDTVRYGAQPRGKNQFSPHALSRILNADEFTKLVARVKQRILNELLAKLGDDPNFVQFSENLQMDDIVSGFLKYSHLPPDVLHRAVDLMYVKAMMEK